MRDPALAARLAAFSVDDGSPALTFTARLARENRWPLAHAQRVVREYLRFVYLASVSPDTLTPSVAVDQAWHLHLCYTRSYWHHLCREILQRELHHGPTRGGSVENTRYHECYERTLRLYVEEFAAAPPEDIWPRPHLRFAADAAPVSVSPRDHVILPRSLLRRATVFASLVPLSLLGLGALASLDDGAGWAATLFVAFFIFVAILVARQSAKKPRDKRHDSGGCGSTGCGHDSSSDGGDSGCGSGCGGGCGGD